MRSDPTEQYFCDLKSQIKGRELLERIDKLMSEHPIMKKYPTPEHLAMLGQPGTNGRSDRDEVLRILLAEIKQGPLLFPLLSFMFWNSLSSIFATKLKSTPNPDDLFARVQLDFYQTLVEYPLDRRPRKVDVNIVLDTRKKVTRWLAEEARCYATHEEFQLRHASALRLRDCSESTVFPEEMEAFLIAKV